MDPQEVIDLRKRMAALETERFRWDQIGHDISDYVAPGRAMWMSYGQIPNWGDDLQSNIIDHTAFRALLVLASGMQAGLTSPARPWFRLGLADDALMEQGDVKDYLGLCERVLYRTYAKSNFYQVMHTAYFDLGAFGTACVYEEEDFNCVVRFKTLSPGEYAIAEGADGRVDALFRRYWRTAAQVVEEFGIKNVSESVKAAFEDHPDTWFQLAHCVQPRMKIMGNSLMGRNKAWQSVNFEMGSTVDTVLRESGFDEFPFFVPRWGTLGSDIYGRGPGHVSLGDVKMLQKMQSQQLTSIELVNKPPVKAGVGLKGRVSALPAGVTFADQATTDSLGPLYQIKPDIMALEQKIMQTRADIKATFFNDLFSVLDQPTPNMTAAEFMERHQEKMLLLGPVTERQVHELLDPITDRTFNILYRLNMLPPAPACIQGMPIKVEYISLLAQAQKMEGTNAIRAATGFALELANANPAVLDKLDLDDAVDQYSELCGVPPGIIVPQDQVQQIRAARAQNQAQQQQQQAMLQRAQAVGQAAQSAKILSETKVGDSSTALGALTDALSGQGGQPPQSAPTGPSPTGAPIPGPLAAQGSQQ